jgi:Co/Zn/Cd efflux system component
MDYLSFSGLIWRIDASCLVHGVSLWHHLISVVTVKTMTKYSVLTLFYICCGITGVPRDLNYHAVKFDLATIPGVKSVHSLNIWSLTLDKVIISVHLAVGKSSSTAACCWQ